MRYKLLQWISVSKRWLQLMEDEDVYVLIFQALMSTRDNHNNGRSTIYKVVDSKHGKCEVMTLDGRPLVQD